MTAPGLQWSSYTPESILKATDAAIEAHRAVQDAVAALPHSQVTFENTAQELSFASAETDAASSALTFLQHVSADAELRKASFESEQKFNDYFAEARMRVDVYEALQAAEKASGPALEGEDARLLRDYLRERRRAGLALPEDKRKALLELQKESSKMESEFNKNAGEASGFLLFTKEELAGLPEDVLEGFPTQEEHGVTKHKMTFKTPDCES
jgi:Zn-dependent oligopeptidase